MIVAEITKDYLTPSPPYSHAGKIYDSEPMQDWWGWDDPVPIDFDELAKLPKTKFKLYDDDGECYYAGWLLNDDGGIVQQYVLGWAQEDSGCTTILVYRDAEAGYIQEIG